jgi:hypothetical protein
MRNQLVVDLALERPDLVPEPVDQSANSSVGVTSSFDARAGWADRRILMSKMEDFYTSTGADGAGQLKYHNESECGYGQEIIRNGHKVNGRRPGDSLCDRCDELAKA